MVVSATKAQVGTGAGLRVSILAMTRGICKVAMLEWSTEPPVVINLR